MSLTAPSAVTPEATDLDQLFLSFRGEIESEQELREQIRVIVRDLEQKTRDISTILQKIHSVGGGAKEIDEICEKAKQEFVAVRSFYSQLTSLIPKNEYYKYSEHYRFTNQRLAYSAALICFLQENRTISRDEAAKSLGVQNGTKSEVNGEFHLDLEEYLIALLNLASELARYSMNCVTRGDYAKPFKIASFINDLDTGFRLLNMKNDGLRKRYDGLKYDVKRVEEVVYDLTIRGLKPKSPVESSAA